jgi:hypothetical protein
MRKAQTSQIAHEILGYLLKHPGARDTFEGILEWWLLEEKIERRRAEVRAALAELLGNGYLLECDGKDARTHYRINEQKYKEIAALYNQDSK